MSGVPMPDHAVLQLAGVSVRLGSGAHAVRALDDISLTVAPGSVTGLVGPDGAGKTTLIRVAAGLLAPDGGSVRAPGLDVATRPDAIAAQIGYMPQRFGLYEELTVAENLDFFGDLQGVARRARSRHYEELLAMTGLAPFLDRLAGKLSGGMKRKLGLACALVRTPQLLLLDEPTVGVDPVSRREVWAIIERLVRGEAGVSVLVSTAYLDETERCDAVFVLDRGRLIDSGPPAGFTQRMTGRAYAASPASGGLRVAAAIAAEHADVVDASPERGRVRVVSRSAGEPRDLGKTDAVAALWFEVPLRGSLVALYAGLALFLLSAVGVGLMISSLALTQQQGLFGAFLFLVPAVILSGFATPIANMPPMLQALTTLNPLRHFEVVLRRVFLEGVTFPVVVPQLVPMALIAAATLIAAAWLFRRRTV